MRIRSRVGAVAMASVLLAGLVVTTAAPAQAIHEGDEASIAGHPFMVSLRLAATPDSPRCGGTLVAPDIVLTAAHCVVGVPQGGIVAVVGADVPNWRRVPVFDTLRHAYPETFDLSVDNRDDVAVVRLATLQLTPTVDLATTEPQVGDRTVTTGWGCTNAPPVCEVMATGLRSSPQTVLDEAASCGTDVFWTRPLYYAPTTICTNGVRAGSTINRGDSGGPLLVPGPSGRGLHQVGVTTLGSDSTTKLYAGFTSLPAEADWIAQAIRTLHGA